MMEVHNLPKWNAIIKYGDLIYEDGEEILDSDERVITYLHSIDELSKEEKIGKQDMVLKLKELHTSHFHSDYFWKEIMDQPKNLKMAQDRIKRELQDLQKKKRRNSKRKSPNIIKF